MFRLLSQVEGRFSRARRGSFSSNRQHTFTQYIHANCSVRAIAINDEVGASTTTQETFSKRSCSGVGMKLQQHEGFNVCLSFCVPASVSFDGLQVHSISNPSELRSASCIQILSPALTPTCTPPERSRVSYVCVPAHVSCVRTNIDDGEHGRVSM